MGTGCDEKSPGKRGETVRQNFKRSCTNQSMCRGRYKALYYVCAVQGSQSGHLTSFWRILGSPNHIGKPSKIWNEAWKLGVGLTKGNVSRPSNQAKMPCLPEQRQKSRKACQPLVSQPFHVGDMPCTRGSPRTPRMSGAARNPAAYPHQWALSLAIAESRGMRLCIQPLKHND